MNLSGAAVRPLFSIPAAPSRTSGGAKKRKRCQENRNARNACNVAPKDKGTGKKPASAQANSKGMFPKPLGVMTYAEMSAEIAQLFFKNTVLTEEVRRLAKENLLLKQKKKQRTFSATQEKQFYEHKIAELHAELERVHQFANSLVNTI